MNAGEGKPFVFDGADNKFAARSASVSLQPGLNQLTLYYDSFSRSETEQRNFEDNFNAFEASRWKLDPVTSETVQLKSEN